MLLVVPLTLTKRFQSGAVDNQARGTRCCTRPLSRKVPAVPAQSGVVRNEQSKSEQPEDAAGESLHLPERQMKDEPQHRSAR